ncbi:hypothetical protein ABWU93_11520 [Xanthomonas translucens pv. translucens]|uniref:hypothetical protein n=1 Tax=Xanthomonas campestris pv. translucens TaxID=343 RepID=UPI003F712D43
MTADTLKSPERSCSRAQTKRMRAAVAAEGGCCYCTRRTALFAGVDRVAACGHAPPRAFPACVLGRDGFDFDEPAFREGAGKTLDLKDSTANG